MNAFERIDEIVWLNGARGTLFYHYAAFLQKLQPKMFLFENVRGLLTHDKGRTYATITNIFEEAGYTIQKKVLNAWDYAVPVNLAFDIATEIYKALEGMYVDQPEEQAMAMAVYMLGFHTYMGFANQMEQQFGAANDGMLKRVYEYAKLMNMKE